jgi:predicted ribosome quality control (RQC) complex YloA/Tae2 family protein
MKTETIYIQGLEREIVFHIGCNQYENFQIIDMCSSDDLWFHASNVSSCHVVSIIPPDIIDKKNLQYIIKAGALLCKNNTNKLKSLKKIEIIYTKIQNITKTTIPGCVITKNCKSIIC